MADLDGTILLTTVVCQPEEEAYGYAKLLLNL